MPIEQNAHHARPRDPDGSVNVSPALRAVAIAAQLLMVAGGAMAVDFSTPEAAMYALETAYIHEDLESAVAARDFAYEARAELLAEKGARHPDPALVARTAEVLELSFRKQINIEGFPDSRGMACSIVGKKALRPDLVRLTQDCLLPDGKKSRGFVHAARSGRGWRIVVLPQPR